MKAPNQRIQARTLHDVGSYFSASEGTLSARIRQLEYEWNLERALEANAASLALIGLALGFAAVLDWWLWQYAFDQRARSLRRYTCPGRRCRLSSFSAVIVITPCAAR